MEHANWIDSTEPARLIMDLENMLEPMSDLRWDVEMTFEQRKTAILQSIGEILQEKHISALTMQNIADKLGLTKGSLYNYFKDKQDILYQCHLRAMHSSLKILDDSTHMQEVPSVRLRKMMNDLVYSVISDRYGAVLITDLESLSTQQRSHYIALRDLFEAGVRQLIADGIEIGEFRACDVKLTALAVLGSINWISRWYDPAGPQSRSEIAESFADLFLRGLQA